MPQYTNYEKQFTLRENFESRRMRIMMRGVKIGAKKGGIKGSSMSIFDYAKKE
jgi:hypothetical protein